MVRLRTAAGALLLPLAVACSASSADPSSADPAPADPPAAASSSPEEELWRPEPGTDWQWQLSGTLDLTVDVPVYDIDGFESTAGDVAALHERGVRVICYINVGAWEEFRPDQGDFPAELLGAGNGWEGERWLDIRAVDTLRPLMAERFDMCRDKGFDAVEPDLPDGYLNETGFPLTAGDQLVYNRMIAGLAHERGLSVGLKNDLPQIPELVDAFDFAVSEECAEFDECELLTPFIEAGKAVFHVEYALPAEEFCPRTTALGFSSMAKNLDLGAWRAPC
jgi:hypothetical protein